MSMEDKEGGLCFCAGTTKYLWLCDLPGQNCFSMVLEDGKTKMKLQAPGVGFLFSHARAPFIVTLILDMHMNPTSKYLGDGF